MLRFWLDEVGDGLVFGTLMVTIAVSAVATLASIPDTGLATVVAEDLAAQSEELREISVAMLPIVELPALAEVIDEDAPDAPDAPAVPVGAPSASSGAPPVAADAEGKGKEKGKGKGSKKRGCEEEPDPGIVLRADDSWTIDRSVVQRYTRDWSRLGELGWSERHEGADGKADGMRIGGIRCGSDLHDAGLRSGDVVNAVNGHPVHNLTEALWVYGKVHDDRVISVEITRRGEPRTLTYSLKG